MEQSVRNKIKHFNKCLNNTQGTEYKVDSMTGVVDDMITLLGQLRLWIFQKSLRATNMDAMDYTPQLHTHLLSITHTYFYNILAEPDLRPTTEDLDSRAAFISQGSAKSASHWYLSQPIKISFDQRCV